MTIVALSTFATGVLTQELNINVISENIANSNTTAYKAQRAIFQTIAYDTKDVGSQTATDGSINPNGMQIGHGVRTAGTVRIMEQGGIQITDRPLDLLINGDGFFQIELPNGETAYTRAGNFVVGPEGYLETIQGYKVLPNITIPPQASEISINAQGQVFVRINNEAQGQEIGTLEITTFINPPGLAAMGDNLFRETPASGQPLNGIPGTDNFGSLMQGALENSNVKPIIAMTDLMAAQRAHGMNIEGMKKTDEMLQQTTRILNT